jgi:hypothetical protein
MWKHVFEPTKGMILDATPTGIPREGATNIQGCYLKDGEVRSEPGYINFPEPGNTKTNALLGNVMLLDQYYTFSGLSFLLCFTTKHIYKYNTSSQAWEVVTMGIEIDDCEAAWDAQANVTSTADTAVHLRDLASAKHVIAAGFTTGIISSEDDLQNVDISGTDNTHLTFWMRANADLANDTLRIRLSEQTAGATGATYADYTIPALEADVWQHVSVELNSPVADDGGTYPSDLNALASVALVANSDPGEVTLYIDDIRTTKELTGDADSRYSGCIYQDAYYFTNGVNKPSKITHVGSVLTHSELSLSLPTGNLTTSEIMFVFKDHMFYVNNTENGADVPQRVSWSNIGDAEDLVNGTAGYQDLLENEEWIIAAKELTENEYALYKEHSIIQCIWVGGHTPFRLTTVNIDVGALNKSCVCELGNGHGVLDAKKIYRYNGQADVQVLDDKVGKRLYAVLNNQRTQRPFVNFAEYDDEFQVWIPTTTDYPDDVWCLNTLTGAWYRKRKSMTGIGYYQEQTSLTIGDLIGTIGDQNWTFGDQLTRAAAPITLVGDENGKIYKLTKMTYNNGDSAISNRFETPDFVLPDKPEYMNYHMRVQQLRYEAKGQSVTTYWSSDGGLTWNPTQGSGSNTQVLSSVYNDYQQDFETTCTKIRFAFENDTLSSGFTLRYYGLYWQLKSGRK